MKIEQIAEMIGGNVLFGTRERQIEITSLDPLDAAGPNSVSFFINPKLTHALVNTEAAVVITRQATETCPSHQIIHANPYAAMAELSMHFNPVTHSHSGISPDARVNVNAQVDASATLYPGVFIDEGATIAPNVVIYPGVFIGRRVSIDSDTVIYANTVIQNDSKIGARVIIHPGVVIGSDGFGFAPTKDDIKKIAQLGRVVIEDDVEIGANSSIDRATFSETRIRRGCKIDSQVHVGHNVDVGAWTMLCGQVGIAGSATIGSKCIAAGKVGISQGISVADGTVLGAASIVLQDINHADEYQGFPAQPSMKWRREVVARRQLSELSRRLKRLEHQLATETNSTT